MELILKIKDGSSPYDYNAYTVFEYEDGNVSPDTRIVQTDSQEDFLARLAHICNQLPNIDEEGNCIYCGQRCQDGQMCDEQQAGGFQNG